MAIGEILSSEIKYKQTETETVDFFVRFQVSLLFSVIYVYTIHQCILFHILKNHKKLRSNFKTCNPSRLEFSNKSPLKDKEKAEILKTKLKNLDT